MRTAQRAIVAMGILGCAALALYPPWRYARVTETLITAPSMAGVDNPRTEEEGHGYAPLWAPPEELTTQSVGFGLMSHEIQRPRIDVSRLLLAWAVAALITAALYVTAGYRRRPPSD
jgi:hypothetical protein